MPRVQDVIIFDAVRSNSDGDVGFLADRRRVNVALTRARRYSSLGVLCP